VTIPRRQMSSGVQLATKAAPYASMTDMGVAEPVWKMRQLNATKDSPTIAITAVPIARRAARDDHLFLANAVMFHLSHRDAVQG